MGIPRLSSAIAPYAETVVLGKALSQTSAITVTRLVIDGPSLVHHLFNALLRDRSYPTIKSSGVLPSYQQINSRLARFLSDLTICGVQINRIVFDGGLPVLKRPEREDRLEKTRRKFEDYRKIQIYPLPSLEFGRNNRSDPNLHGVHNEPKEVLRNTLNAFSKDRLLLPPPPFMVASVIEWLQKSEWSSVVVTVPGEADPYCASEASTFDAAILSNDSDLLLYDIGENGVVLTMRTLEPVEDTSNSGHGWLKGRGYRLIKLARSLGVSNLLAFGFFRFMDHTASTAQCVQQTRSQTLTDSNSDWVNFQQQYQMPSHSALNHVSDIGCVHCSIQNLDPRISELICSMRESEILHIHLPILIEDPTRDSSWSYGQDIRTVAYSILLSCDDIGSLQDKYSHVVEYARKGARVAGCEVEKLSEVEMIKRLKLLCDRLTPQSSKSGTSFNNISIGEQGLSTDTRLTYHLLAADIVIDQRVAKDKEYQPSLSKILPLTISRKPVPRLTWEDIHFHANIQCVLYSLRILKQIISYAEPRLPANVSDEIHSLTKRLGAILGNMPDIEELFLDAESLRRWIMTLPRENLSDGIRRKEKVAPISSVDSHDGVTIASDFPGRSADNISAERHESVPYQHQTLPEQHRLVPEQHDDPSWHIVENKNSKKRRNVQTSASTTTNSSRPKTIGRHT